VIKSFKDKETQRLFMGRKSRAVSERATRKAIRKLEQLDVAEKVEDMATPPSNRLHKLSGDREGRWAINVDRQYRILFRFEDGDAHDVEATDYH
jgi:proteic killer suppression protein